MVIIDHSNLLKHFVCAEIKHGQNDLKQTSLHVSDRTTCIHFPPAKVTIRTYEDSIAKGHQSLPSHVYRCNVIFRKGALQWSTRFWGISRGGYAHFGTAGNSQIVVSMGGNNNFWTHTKLPILTICNFWAFFHPLMFSKAHPYDVPSGFFESSPSRCAKLRGGPAIGQLVNLRCGFKIFRMPTPNANLSHKIAGLVTPLKFNIAPWKMVVGRPLSYWEGYVSGAMSNFGRVRDY